MSNYKVQVVVYNSDIIVMLMLLFLQAEVERLIIECERLKSQLVSTEE